MYLLGRRRSSCGSGPGRLYTFRRTLHRTFPIRIARRPCTSAGGPRTRGTHRIGEVDFDSFDSDILGTRSHGEDSGGCREACRTSAYWPEPWAAGGQADGSSLERSAASGWEGTTNRSKSKTYQACLIGAEAADWRCEEADFRLCTQTELHQDGGETRATKGGKGKSRLRPITPSS